MVGAGWIAQEHRRVLGSMADAELAAVCDIDPERAGSLAAGTGARTYSDWRDLLDREDLGALIVCTPPRSHRDPAVAALNHGLPVYLEKPIARTLELASGALATVVVAWTRPGQPGRYGLDIIASEATLRLALDPDFTLSGVSRGQPVTRRAASHPLERSVRRFLDAAGRHDPAAVACPPP